MPGVRSFYLVWVALCAASLLWQCISYYYATGGTGSGFIYLTGQYTYDQTYHWIGLLLLPWSIGGIAMVAYAFMGKPRIPSLGAWAFFAFFGGIYASLKVRDWVQDGGDTFTTFLGAIGIALISAILLDWVRSKGVSLPAATS